MSTLDHPRRVVAITDIRTGGAHLVTEDAWAAGRRAGRSTTVCSSELLAASLTADSERSCKDCQRRVGSR